MDAPIKLEHDIGGKVAEIQWIKKGTQMILSVSRRTDIPAFFHEWFLNRIDEGFVLVRNTMNSSQIGKVTLSLDIVDCIVFWSKNPAAMLASLGRLSDYHYYFQFTITPYGKNIEPNLPDKAKIIDTFRRLADRLGPHRVVWRYDPIFIGTSHSVSYHVESFGKMANSLLGYTEKSIISFIEPYRKIKHNMADGKMRVVDTEAKHEIAEQLAKTACENSLALETCAQDIDLSRYGIARAKCIDGDLVERIIGCPLDVEKDKSGRPNCECATSIDIGAYNTCPHGCIYCYANYQHSSVLENLKNHDGSSALLIGAGTEIGTCTERAAKSNR